MKFENKKNPLLEPRKFYVRVLKYFFYSSFLISISLAIGTFGYSYFEGLPLVDGFLNASMILTGMGPVNPMTSDSAKLFAAFYSLYSGIAFLTTVAVFFAPIVHRFMHSLHIDDDEFIDDKNG